MADLGFEHMKKAKEIKIVNYFQQEKKNCV